MQVSIAVEFLDGIRILVPIFLNYVTFKFDLSFDIFNDTNAERNQIPGEERAHVLVRL